MVTSQSEASWLKVPKGLANLQRDFGQAISRPFLFDANDSGDYRLDQERYPEGIVDLMVAQEERGLSGADRLATYNRQYWFRLLTIMQKEYPLCVALMGLLPFNQMVMAYLDAHPPNNRNLRDLSNRLSHFLKGQTEWSLQPIRQAVHMEFLMIQAFDAPCEVPLNPTSMDDAARAGLTTQQLRFQPHWFPFKEDWNLVHWHAEVKGKSQPESVEVDLKPGTSWWVIYRHGKVRTLQLGPLQYRLLGLLSQGLSIESALSRMSEELTQEQLEFLQQNIGPWFAHWMTLGWFTAPHQPLADQ